MVWQLICLGIIKGADVVLDGARQRICYRKDPEADWSDPKPGQGSTWGYKVHALLRRWLAYLWFGIGSLAWPCRRLAAYGSGLFGYAWCRFVHPSFSTSQLAGARTKVLAVKTVP